MALGPATVVDFFTRSVSNDWGTTSSGHSWVGTDFDFYDVDGSNGKIYVSSSRSSPSYHTHILGINESTAEVLVKVRWNTDNETNHGPTLRRKDTNNYYTCRIRDDAHLLSIESTIGGSRSVLASYSVSLSKNTDYWVRFRCDTNLKAKIWADNVAEPGSWQVTASYAAGGPTTGSFGYRNAKTSGGTYTVLVDAFFGYLGTELSPSLPVTDSFASRTSDDGLGRASSGHLWFGDLSLDPESYANGGAGSVSAGTGVVTVPGGGGYRRGFIGQSSSTTEGYLKIKVSATGGTAQLGIHAAPAYTSGAAAGAAYYACLEWGSTAFRVYDRDGSTILGSFTLAAAPVAGETWCLKAQGNGANIQAKAWKDGTTEPAFQINVTDATSPVTSGCCAVSLSDGGSSTTFTFYDFSFGFLATNTNRPTTSAFLASTIGTNWARLLASWTDDVNDNCTVVMQIREQGSSTWTTATPVVHDYTTNTAAIDFTGLTADTTYEIQATWTDADGVLGTNPRTNTFTTLATGVAPDDVVFSPWSTSLNVVANYTKDSDNDSTAFLQAIAGGTFTQLTTDTFTDTNGTNLGAHTGEALATWTRHTNSPANNLKIDSNEIYADTAAGAFYYSSATPATPDYTITGILGRASENDSTVSLLARVNTSANTYYALQYSITPNTSSTHNLLSLIKVVSGTVTTLASYKTTLAPDDPVVFALRGSLLIGYVSSVAVLAAWDTSITAAGRVGIKGTGNSGGTKALTWRSINSNAPNATSYQVQLTPDRSNKRFTGSLPGLTADTNYQAMVVFFDPDGVQGTNPQQDSILTAGVGVVPTTLAAIPGDISAVVTASYELDTNENSTCDFLYKSIRDDLWTSVNSEAVLVSRGGRTFSTVLTGLVPNLSYQLQAVFTDPDGITTGYSDTLNEVFTTTGRVYDPDYRGKHYVWKIYNRDGVYVGTWHDAPEPEFEYFADGGVSNMSPTLPRTLGQIKNDKTLGLGYRVDIWALDGQSNGMGPNLILDGDMELGSWTLATSWSVSQTDGPDGGAALKFSSASSTVCTIQSEIINLASVTPLVVSAIAKASGGKLRFDIAAYNASNTLLDTSTEVAETIGPMWQSIHLKWLPPPTTAYVRVRAENVGAGTMVFDKVRVLPQEYLIYRGIIEEYEPALTKDGESVKLQILGPVAQLADMYIRHLQYVNQQPSEDIEEELPYEAPTDPSNMMMDIIDYAQSVNPKFMITYTADSINLTDTVVEYTFKGMTIQDCFAKIVDLSPPGWTYFVDATGLLHFNGPDDMTTHNLRLQVEVMEFSNRFSINDLKNYVIVEGRKDSDESEPDGEGTIEYIAFDQDSIDLYGRREERVTDENIKDSRTAEIVGDGKLDELNRPTEQGNALIPDEKDLRFAGSVLRGYNIEAFRPGDFVTFRDPKLSDNFSYWDDLEWDVDKWDSNDEPLISARVPIKNIKYKGTSVELELTERAPSATGDYAKMRKWQRLKDQVQNR